ncbi:MAG: HEAT repeat domain-containing protein [Verrucomicrobia bacterium]|nr:HEAT repeat domain-containing protein [Verrucomicrobiota bacterium]
MQEIKARLASPGREAWAALVALGHLSSNEATELLRETATHPDWRYRRLAMVAMGDHPRTTDLGLMIMRALDDPSPHVVRAACEAAARLSLSATHDKVLRLLASGDKETRLAALTGLSELWEPTDFFMVLHVFRADREERIRREAAWVLCTNADATTWERLFSEWRHDPLPRHRVWACRLTARLGAPKHVAALEVFFNDRDRHVRKAARAAMDTLTAR